MALLDFLKKKQKKEKEENLAKDQPTPVKAKEKRTALTFSVLKSPQITEKATELAKDNQYTFKVLLDSNKTEVKKELEELYGVDVVGVKIVKSPKKQRKVGRISGWRKGYKKAIVRIKEGQKIEVLPR